MKKEKPWEAKIPNNYEEHNWISGWPDIPDSEFRDAKNIIMDLTASEKDEAIQWIKKQKIKMNSWQEISYADTVQQNGYFIKRSKYIFRFNKDEDAMAFKLGWM